MQHSAGLCTACPHGRRPKVVLPSQHSRFEGLARCSQHLAHTADGRSPCTLLASLCSIRSSKSGVVGAVRSAVCDPGWGGLSQYRPAIHNVHRGVNRSQAASRCQVPSAYWQPLTSAVAARQLRAALRAAASTAAGPSAARLAELAPPPTPLLLRRPSSGPCPMALSTLIIALHACPSARPHSVVAHPPVWPQLTPGAVALQQCKSVIAISHGPTCCRCCRRRRR
jgi:hypothetical protein